MFCFLFLPSSLVSTSRSVPRKTCNTEPASQSFFFADFNFLRLRPRASSTRRRRLLPEGVVLAGVRPGASALGVAPRPWRTVRLPSPPPRFARAFEPLGARALARRPRSRGSSHRAGSARRAPASACSPRPARRRSVATTAGTLLARASLAPPRLTPIPPPRTDPPRSSQARDRRGEASSPRAWVPPRRRPRGPLPPPATGAADPAPPPTAPRTWPRPSRPSATPRDPSRRGSGASARRTRRSARARAGASTRSGRRTRTTTTTRGWGASEEISAEERDGSSGAASPPSPRTPRSSSRVSSSSPRASP